jgi:hypothetical protein
VRRDPIVLVAVLSAGVLLSCGDDEPACETREAALAGQRWILECGTETSIPEAGRVASYFDPEWTEELPSGVHIYCSDRGLAVAWTPGVRTVERSARWREKIVTHRIDGGRRIQDRWIVRTDASGRPTYYLFATESARFVEALREARELLLETRVDQEEESVTRLVTLEGLPRVLDWIPCSPED